MQGKRVGSSKKTRAGRWAGVCFLLVFLAQFSMPFCLSQEPAAIPSSVQSPQDIEKWLSGFKSQMTIPDVPQTVPEMLNSRAGDCDDFAKLASKALAGFGISSRVVVIKYKGTPMRHAICLWKNENGTYDFFSTQTRVRTGETSLDAVLNRYYPTFESVSILDVGDRGMF